MRLGRTLAVLSLLMSAELATSTSPAAGRELTFTEPDKLAYALPSDDYERVWLRSDGASGKDITWQLLVDKGDATAVTVPEAVEPDAGRGPVLEIRGPKGIRPNTVAAYKVRVRDLATDDVEGAQLVARVRGAAPASLDASISDKNDVSPTLDSVLIAPLIVALILLAIRGVTMRNGFGGAVGTVDLDFSKSFATTLTAIGALLGTILSAGLLDDATPGISKEGFQALNLTFGVLVLVAPLVYLLFQRQVTTETRRGNPPKSTKETHYQGKAWALLLAGGITLWAVLGEIVTIYLLLEQLNAAGEISSTAIMIMQVAVGIGAILAVAYSWRKLRWIVEAAAGEPAPALAGGFLPAEAFGRPSTGLPSWTPL